MQELKSILYETTYTQLVSFTALQTRLVRNFLNAKALQVVPETRNSRKGPENSAIKFAAAVRTTNISCKSEYDKSPGMMRVEYCSIKQSIRIFVQFISSFLLFIPHILLLLHQAIILSRTQTFTQI